MLHQGFGREEILRRINQSTTAAESVDWRLLKAGAGNPIGNLRVKEAAQWLEHNTGAMRGFTDEEVASRGEDFAEYLASHGLFVAGSSGVQDAWPKMLLIVPSSASAREMRAALIVWFSSKIAPTACQTCASRYKTRSNYVLKNRSHPTLMVFLRLYHRTPATQKNCFHTLSTNLHPARDVSQTQIPLPDRSQQRRSQGPYAPQRGQRVGVRAVCAAATGLGRMVLARGLRGLGKWAIALPYAKSQRRGLPHSPRAGGVGQPWAGRVFHRCRSAIRG